eukprot:TRINITY_DN2858_c1_g1_i2.p1 TRINITY_DN2858_c1_g1~~TRINITY_DN2858_c1_g1_i2.p1  ORF type:complete len:276 (-),score=52.82 TRINITY_DN2858_c1_g1_i2:414-1241(-)
MSEQQVYGRGSAGTNSAQPIQTNAYNAAAGIRQQNLSVNQNLSQGNYQSKSQMDNNGGGGCWDDLGSSRQPDNPQQQLQFNAQKYQQQYHTSSGRGGGRQNGYSFGGQQTFRRGPQTSGTNFKDGIKVYISDLAPTVDWRMLKDFLRQAGSVTFASNWKDGTGVGEFATMQDAMASIRLLSGTPLHGSAIRISMEKGSTAGGGSMTSFSGGRQGGRGGGGYSYAPNPFSGPRQPQNNMQFTSYGGGGGYSVRGVGQQYDNNELSIRRRQNRYNPY